MIAWVAWSVARESVKSPSFLIASDKAQTAYVTYITHLSNEVVLDGRINQAVGRRF